MLHGDIFSFAQSFLLLQIETRMFKGIPTILVAAVFCYLPLYRLYVLQSSKGKEISIRQTNTGSIKMQHIFSTFGQPCQHLYVDKITRNVEKFCRNVGKFLRNVDKFLRIVDKFLQNVDKLC